MIARMLAPLLLMLSGLGLAAAEPQSIHSTYSVYYLGARVGEVTETYARTGDHYQIESVARPNKLAELFLPTVTETSTGSVTATGLRPTRFAYSRTGDGNKNTSADFHWDRNKIDLTFEGRTESRDLAPDTLDTLSMKYQFLFRLPTSGDNELAMTNGKKVSSYRYRLVKEEAVTTPAGTFQAFHFTNLPEPGEAQLDMWLAKDTGFPVRIVRKDKSSTIEQVVSHLAIEPAPAGARPQP